MANIRITRLQLFFFKYLSYSAFIWHNFLIVSVSKDFDKFALFLLENQTDNFLDNIMKFLFAFRLKF